MNFNDAIQVKLGNSAEIDLIKLGNGPVIYERIPLYVPYEFKGRSDIEHVKTMVNKTHTDLSYMFYESYNLLSVTTRNWNTSNVTTMKSMFEGSRIGSWGLDLSSFNTSKVIDMSGMFSGCLITTLDVSNFDTSQVTDMSFMFSGCELLGTLDINNWDIRNVTDIRSMFAFCNSLTSLDLSNWDTSHITSMSGMFNSCASLSSLDLSNWNTSNATSLYSMFNGCNYLKTLRLDNCDNTTIKKIMGTSTLPTGKTPNGSTRYVYCKEENFIGAAYPEGWAPKFI